MAGTKLTGRQLTPLQRSNMLAMIVDGTMSNAEIAIWMGCDVRTIQRWRRRYSLTGDFGWFSKSPSRFNSVQLFPWAFDKLIEELTAKPDYYLDEMQWFLAQHCNVYVSTTTVSRHLTEYDWANKKTEIRTGKQDPEKRLEYISQTAEYTADMFVFVDESGVEKRDVNRRYGWAPKGHTPFEAKVLQPGSRFSVVPAITVDGILDEATLIYQGSTLKDEDFTSWLKEKVVPLMNPFPGPRSVLVMDNATFHHSLAITALEESGIKIIYLPDYSPDYNPVEPFLGMLKVHMRRHATWREDEFGSEDEFRDFLAACVRDVGRNVEETRWYFAKARVGSDLVAS